MKRTTVTTVLLAFLLSVCSAQEQKERDFSKLQPNFFVPNDGATSALFPPTVLNADTAIVVRYTLLLAVSGWNNAAACDANGKALSFWGERYQLSPEVCSDLESVAVMFAYGLLRVMENEFPEVAGPYGLLMKALGYDPSDRSTDRTTALGFANSDGIRIAEWFAKDGWNSLGDLSRSDFQQRFEDYTGYTPINSPWALQYPLRWQPLVQADERPGRFNAQTHVVPFLGQLRPLLLTQEELESRQVDPPYENMGSTELSGKDAETVDFLVKELFNVSANLTPEERVSAIWWDNKFTSAGFVLPFHSVALQLTPFEFVRAGLGEALAQYDAMLLAWKEKRRVDAVRPESIIREFYKDEEVTAFVSETEAEKTIKAGDWKPLIPTQPHSEFPSASATLCTAFADHGTFIMKEFVEARGLEKEPPFALPVAFVPTLAGILPEEVTSIGFDTYAEAGKACGESRLWAGVHFRPSVPAGEKLAEGVGEKAYEFVKKLSMGVVPGNCWWCTEA